MYPKQHILFGFLFSLILFLIFPQITIIGFSIIFLSAILIDFDHYVYYVFKKKDSNLKNAYNWFAEKNRKFRMLPWDKRQFHKDIPCLLHGIEILLIISILFFFTSKYFLFVFIGFAFHLLLDSVEQTIYWDRIDKVSIIYDILNSKYSF